MKIFNLVSSFNPAGDQPKAIKYLIDSTNRNERDQVLLGVTGSGKTFTMAHVIANTGRPALIMAHNKTLAAQLYEEMREFFPGNAVEYFVSYYDYYQPEAYIPTTDTYIEKDAAINERIDLLRHSATRSLLERSDVIVIASVSCIYGLGAPELYMEMTVKLNKNDVIDMNVLQRKLVEVQYTRNDMNFHRSTFRISGDVFDIFPSHYENRAWRVIFFGNEIEEIYEFDPLTGDKIIELENITIFASSHYVVPRPTLQQAVDAIMRDMKTQVAHYRDIGKLLEAERLEQRTLFDIEMMKETGACKGIENYSRYLSGRNPGEPPPTLFEYLPKDAILFIDESHVTVPQIGGMYNGDRVRKTTLIEHGFRLSSALDNRPLKFEEWESMRPQTIYISATPGKYELNVTSGVFVEQVIRPTGLVDPECIIRPVEHQVDDIIAECASVIQNNLRILITTLTKKMAEDLAGYMADLNMKVTYLHSDIDTLERVNIIKALRLGTIDVLIGVNLLREGLDIPECGLVAIMDADKEGFLRSEISLIQTIGRAARNAEGRVILYADKMTNSLKKALDETNRRRAKQLEHNERHGITPRTIKKNISNALQDATSKKDGKNSNIDKKDAKKRIKIIKKEMLEAAKNLDFELATKLRDELKDIS